MRWRSVMAALCCAMMLCSCEADLRDLCDDHNHWATAKVSFDWQKAPKATAKSMTVLFYNMDYAVQDPIRYDFGMEGGTARLEPCTWRAVTYNNDTETIRYRGMDDYQTLEAYTRSSSIEESTQMRATGMPRAAGTELEPIILEPDPLWGCASNPFTLGSDQRDVDLVLKPDHRYSTITLTIDDVPNLQYTGSFGGAMSGLAASRWMASGIPGDETATEAFTVSVVGEKTLQASFRIFGHCPHGNNPHLLTIYAILADGQKWYYVIDVTDQMHQGGGGGDDENINIKIDGLPLPKPIVNGSGFQPTIDGWQGVEIEVGM